MADFDGVWKRLFQNFTSEALTTLCGVETEGCKIVERPTEYSKSVRADLVYEVLSPTGEPTIVHIEIQSHRNPIFHRRMVLYWAMLYDTHERPPRQIVILPRGGSWYTGFYRDAGLTLTYDVVDVTALDPETLLGTDLAPLALAASRRPERLIDQVMARIATPTLDRDRRAALLEMVMLTAGPALVKQIVDSLRRHDMSDLLESVPEIRAIAERSEAKGKAEGKAEGKARGRAEVLRTMLVDKFGDHADLDAIAARLADGDLTDAIHRIRDAATLDATRP